MVEQGERGKVGSEDGAEDVPAATAETAASILSARLEQSSFPDYPGDQGTARDKLHDVQEHAARSVDRLVEQVESRRRDVTRPRWPGVREVEADSPEHRSPEEIVGAVLVTAHRAAEAVIEKAQLDAESITAEAHREAAPIISEARRTLDDARRLRDEATDAVEQARLEAERLLEASRETREHLLADLTAEGEQRQSELEAACARLETTLRNVRAEWTGRIATALSQLDSLDLETTLSSEIAGTTSREPRSELEPGPGGHERRSTDVMHDLRSRILERGSLPEGGDVTRTQPPGPGESMSQDSADNPADHSG